MWQIAAIVVILLSLAYYIHTNPEEFDTYGNYRVASEITTGRPWPYGRWAIHDHDYYGKGIYDDLTGASLYGTWQTEAAPGRAIYATREADMLGTDLYEDNPSFEVNGMTETLNQGY